MPETPYQGDDRHGKSSGGERIASLLLRFQAASDTSLSGLQFQGSNSSMQVLGVSGEHFDEPAQRVDAVNLGGFDGGKPCQSVETGGFPPSPIDVEPDQMQ